MNENLKPQELLKAEEVIRTLQAQCNQHLAEKASMTTKINQLEETTFELGARNASLSGRVGILETSLTKWKEYFQSNKHADPETDGEAFTDAWYQMEEALK